MLGDVLIGDVRGWVDRVCHDSAGATFEAFAQMRLHSPWLLGLRQNLQQLIVGEKKEPRKIEPFHLEIIVQPLGDFFQFLVGFFEFFFKFFVGVSLGPEVWVGGAVGEGFAPQSINALKPGSERGEGGRGG